MESVLDFVPRLGPVSMNSRTGPFRGVWREAGLFDFSDIFGFANKRNKLNQTN
jgi:hypothetical protein